ncbi:hypothetical protein NECAME_11924 [Necator americanus]|uniref:7TM GPCR serpentine receptor class x (Srx) domain-containing protein n=1 Tax=Necator americanus TaxID=51031 RepID=W2T3G1_NECAM|nr:hypothetical protein NECAME_11924 [Necator americanus]ETN76099.1 hypothetical protein NECAME_11924 [Necator americanus]
MNDVKNLVRNHKHIHLKNNLRKDLRNSISSHQNRSHHLEKAPFSPFLMETDRDRLDQIIAGIIILAIALVGGAVNISALMVIYRSPMFHNSFGILCASHIISDIGFLLPHIFWAAPSEILYV